MIRILTYSPSHTVKKLGFNTSTWLEGRIEKYKNDVIVRWGNASHIFNRYSQMSEFINVLNPARAVSLNMNKIEAHDVMSKVVRVPRLFRKHTPNFGLFVVRPVVHQGGSGFRVVEANGKAITLSEGQQYATDFLRTNAEYRVWFCGDRTLRAQRSRTVEQQEAGPVDRFPCRSKWGYNFCNGVPNTLHNQTLKAAKAIGLDVGAADVLLHDNHWYFLELNSAPSTDLPVLNRWMKDSINRLATGRFGL